MTLRRTVVFLSDGILGQYDAIADSAATSRSSLIRWALEHALPHVREHAFVAASAVAGAPPVGVVPPAPRPRRRGRPPASENARRLVYLQEQARVVLEEAPEMEEDALRRVLLSIAGATLGLADDSPLYEQATRVVLDNPDNRPPRPVEGQRPPKQ